ncbi:chemotaxis-specific protein-glutamate methyltransferase CheB [Opitutus sp. ER46]|uniref:chemotaxis-specific protein-glutamate methyltransferase CheB n=1 Tax=Opitutus sp. ER46 TaxID=2161864 RepID=UPI000D31E900|nr:chemotaxis-specific protein-glutamate methyltransferase CheB [Opitutus sp. ER46]PTX90710.1 chemotaxis response regulator protein-glutamate methylesterase [Opitutus sp. ER46]
MAIAATPVPSARPGALRVLVVDDSPFMQRRMGELLERDGDLRIVGTARDGLDAIRRAAELQPDVITMDIQMPRMDGLAAIEQIMGTQPRPIVVVSSVVRSDSAAAIAALERGAVEVIAKPSEGAISLDLAHIGHELRRKVRLAARVRVVRTARRPGPVAPVATAGVSELPRGQSTAEPSLAAPPEPASDALTLIGCSTGGPAALLELARSWRGAELPPVIVAQHLPAEFTGELARQMAEHLGGSVREAQTGDRPRSGVVLIAPGGQHVDLDAAGVVRLVPARATDPWVPSIDRLFESGAAAYGARTLGIVLTGMGNDGTAGARAISGAGGTVWAQDEASSIIDGMPRAVREAGHAARVLPLGEIGRALIRKPRPLLSS